MFIDSHAHIDGVEFDQDREQVVERALAAGVSTILNVGTGDPHSDAFERAVELGQRNTAVYTAIGTHPHDARFYNDAAEEKTKRLIEQNSKVIAWGEVDSIFIMIIHRATCRFLCLQSIAVRYKVGPSGNYSHSRSRV